MAPDCVQMGWQLFEGLSCRQYPTLQRRLEAISHISATLTYGIDPSLRWGDGQ